MALFKIPERKGRELDDKIASSKYQKSNIKIQGGKSLLERISNITDMVNKNLGKYADESIVIQDEDSLIKYIDKCIENKLISIDTETNSLDPITCTLAGISIYTQNEKPAYIPVNHVSYITGLKVKNQLSKEFLTEQFNRIAECEDIEIIMFNAKFDVRVLRNQINVYLKATWDGYIAARLLNENEQVNGLKALHNKYCLNGEGDAFAFESLFKGIPFTHIPIKTGYLYAAHDAIVTYELYMFQKPFLTIGNEVCKEYDLERVAKLFHTVEMEVINVVADMEDAGVGFDFEYADELSKKYNKLLEEKQKDFYKICDKYKDKIEDYKIKHLNHKLENPISISSPQQLAILFYDILKIGVVDKEKPRGTGVDILEKMDNELSKSILEFRTVSKLLSTYIDKLPNTANKKDGRIHCSFNQIGADTGRFSSSNPNLNKWVIC